MRLSELVKEVFRGNFPPRKVIFRVDAGRVKGLSFGHLFRCMLFAKKLRKYYGADIVFLMRDHKDGVACARSFGYRVTTLKRSLSGAGHDEAVIGHIRKIGPDHIVVDLPYGTPNAYLDYARSRHVFTICIDDMAERSFRADVVLNSGILAQRKRYKACLPKTRFLLGMEYFPMDERSDIEKSFTKNGRPRILITFGGSDPSGLTGKTLRALAKIDSGNVRFEVLLGPGFKGRRSVKSALRVLSGKASVFDYPKDPLKYFYRSDLVVCAGGTTLYALCAIGKPCIAIPSNASESRVIKKFREKKHILAGLDKWDEILFLKELKRGIGGVPDIRRRLEARVPG